MEANRIIKMITYFYLTFIFTFVLYIGKITYEAFIKKACDEKKRHIIIKSMAQSYVVIFFVAVVSSLLEIYDISVFGEDEVQPFIIYIIIFWITIFVNKKLNNRKGGKR